MCDKLNEVMVGLNDVRQAIVNNVNDKLLVHQCDAFNLWSGEYIHHLHSTSYAK